jgi:hypothetical protein
MTKKKSSVKQASMFTVEEEGFALVSPPGEHKAVEIPRGSQEFLFDVGKPDRSKMEEIRRRELEERSTRKAKRSKRKSNPEDNWLDDLTRDDAIALMETSDYVSIGVLASGRPVVSVGKVSPDPGRFGQQVREFLFHCPEEWLPVLADRADELGRVELAAQLRAAFIEMNRRGYPAFSSIDKGSLEDLDAVNNHRRQLGMKSLDMADGWTAREIADMAEKIRTTGRMANPVSIKRKLMR